MQEEKLITIITTLYNKAPYLETWAISVAAQTYLDKARVIVIDDGSTDGGLELVKEYAAKYQIPIEIFVHEKNCGMLRTMLDSYHLLDTKYFTMLDADDYWLTEKKLEKAIDFLEAHEDYSAYASNYIVLLRDGMKHPVFSKDLPDQTFSRIRDTREIFQTSTTVFRNFFTPALVNELESAAAGKFFHALETDTFRNYLTFHFGKIRFENSFDAVWRADIGNFGSLKELEKYLLITHQLYQIFDFYHKQFGLDDNAVFILQNSYDYYCRAVDILSASLKDFSLFEIELKNYFRKSFFDCGYSDLEKIFGALLRQANVFKKLGFKVTGENVSVDFPTEYLKAKAQP